MYDYYQQFLKNKTAYNDDRSFYLVPGWNAASSCQTSVKGGITDIRSNTGGIREKVFRRTSSTCVSIAGTALQTKITLKDIDKPKINLACQTVTVNK